eukprot:1139625-Pelagomonas_calceolata.AAC.1
MHARTHTHTHAHTRTHAHTHTHTHTRYKSSAQADSCTLGIKHFQAQAIGARAAVPLSLARNEISIDASIPSGGLHQPQQLHQGAQVSSEDQAQSFERVLDVSVTALQEHTKLMPWPACKEEESLFRWQLDVHAPCCYQDNSPFFLQGSVTAVLLQAVTCIATSLIPKAWYP